MLAAALSIAGCGTDKGAGPADGAATRPDAAQDAAVVDGLADLSIRDSHASSDAGDSTDANRRDVGLAADAGPLDQGRDLATSDGANSDIGAQPLRLLSAMALSHTALQLRFSHPVDQTSAESPENYTIVGLPVFAATRGVEPSTVRVDTHYQLAPDYRVAVADLRSEDGSPLAQDSGETSLTARSLSRLGADSFETGGLGQRLAEGWVVVDDPRATAFAPSDWAIRNGRLEQTSNIFGGSATDRFRADKPGTYFVAGHLSSRGQTVQATLESGDDDGIGLVVRFVDANTHYRFQWFNQGRHRELVKVSGGQVTRLNFDMQPYQRSRSYRVRLTAEESRLTLFIDDQLVLAAEDPHPISAGSPGLYCWGNSACTFDEFIASELPTDSQHAMPSAVQQPPHSAAPIITTMPMSGDPRPTRLSLWARASGPAQIAWQFSTGADFAPSDQTTFVPVTETTNFAARVDLGGLSPNTLYRLRPIVANADQPSRWNFGPTISARTAPLPSTDAPVTFAFCADIHEATHNPTLLGLLAQLGTHRPDFAVVLGDFPYADGAPAAANQQEYWDKHTVVRAMPHVGDLLRAQPLVAVWDDHEVVNDWDSSRPADLIRYGVKAWHDFFAAAPVPPADSGLYRRLSFGRHLDLFILDTRYYRDPKLQPDDADKTMLGTAQKSWLKEQLLQSTASFKFIVSSVPLRFGTTGSDYWEGYATERSELFAFLQQHNISGIAFLSGDQHWAAVHNHPEGYSEIMAGPVSAAPRLPPDPLPDAVSFAHSVRSYGLVSITTDEGGPLATIDLFEWGPQRIHRRVLRP